MAIRNELMDLLISPDVASRLNFSINGRQVNGALIRSVKEAIERYTIYIVVDRNVTDHSATRNGLTGAVTSGGADAQYDASNNSFIFPTDQFANEHKRALALHEAVHAAFDINRYRMWAIDDEAAAYIAQCIYLRVKRETITNMTPTFQAADAAAAAIMSPGGTLTPALLQALEQALLNNPLYHNINSRTSTYPRNG